MMKPGAKTCRSCYGSGKVKAKDGKQETCPLCKGLGKVGKGYLTK